MRKTKSTILEAVHDTAKGLHRAGAMDQVTLSSWLELYENNSSSDIVLLNENAISFLQTAHKKAMDVAQTLLDFPMSAFFMGTTTAWSR